MLKMIRIFAFLLICPFFLRNIFRISVTPAILISLIISALPAVVWWSFSPLEILWPLLAILTVISWPTTNLNVQKITLTTKMSATRIAVIGFLMARIPLMYQPWSLPMAILFVSIGIGFLVNLRGPLRKVLFKESVLGSSIGVFIFGITYFLQRGDWKVFAQTVYPGLRRSDPGYLGINLLSGPFDFVLRSPSHARYLIGTNQSEAALAPLIFLLPVIVFSLISIFLPKILVDRTIFLATIPTLLYFGIWIAIPALAHNVFFFPMRIIPSSRLAQVGGIAVTLIFLALIQNLKVPNQQTRILMLGLLSLLLMASSFYGYHHLSQNGIILGNRIGLLLSTLFTASVLSVVAFPKRGFSLVLLLLYFLFTSAGAFPITQGTGDLKNSVAAKQVQAIAATEGAGGLWASDSMGADALISAQGISKLSGQLGMGPSLSKWKILDPTNKWKNAWNRGSSYLYFSWNQENKTIIDSPQADTVVVRIDPCNRALNKLNLKYITSGMELKPMCIKPIAKLIWNNSILYIYERTAR